MPLKSSDNLRGGLLLTPDEVATAAQSLPSVRPTRTHGQRSKRVWPSSGRLLEIALVTAVVVLAGVLRFYYLALLPFGLHGDEAVTGLVGQRILQEGNIGPYSGEALGQPTGPLYLTALSVRLFGHTVFAVRAISALVGTLTVLALYLVMRRSFGVATALIGAALLATMSWHVHFARLGFPLETWPFCIVLTAGAVVEALRRNDWRWWLASGLLAGIGVYSYNAHPLLLAILALFVAIATLQGRARAGRPGLAPRLLGPVLMALVIVATAWPLIVYALNPKHEYLSHIQLFSIFRREAWTGQQTVGDKAQFLGGRYRSYWDAVCCHPVVDGADGTGLTPLAPGALLLLACVGAIVGIRRRQPLALLSALIVLLIPWASVITIDGLARRTFAAAPFLALLGALPLGWLVEWGLARWQATRLLGRAVPAAVFAGVLALLLAIGPYSLAQYFRVFAPSQEQAWVFNSDLYDATLYMNTLPAGSYVYFLGERWPLNHETVLYLAPRVAGEDRSEEYGKRTDLDTDRTSGTIAYVCFGRYTALVDEVAARYPQGTLTVGSHEGRQTFVAYRVELGGATAGR